MCFAETHGRKVDSPCHLKYAYFAADVFCASRSQILDHRGPFDGEKRVLQDSSIGYEICCFYVAAYGPSEDCPQHNHARNYPHPK
jgi:hypothetical protein